MFGRLDIAVAPYLFLPKIVTGASQQGKTHQDEPKPFHVHVFVMVKVKIFIEMRKHASF